MNDRYTWGAHGAKYPTLNVIDWGHPGGPKVIGAVPQQNDGPDEAPWRDSGVEAAKAIVRLMQVTP